MLLKARAQGSFRLARVLCDLTAMA